MIIRVICIGKSKLSPPEHCTAGQFGAFCNGVAEFPIIKEDVPKMKSRGYDIYIAPGRAAAQTAELFFENAETIEEPLLSSLPLKEDTSTGKIRSRKFWEFLLYLWYTFGAGHKALSKQTEELLKRLEEKGKSCILVCPPQVARVLLGKLRNRNYVVTRSGSFFPKPLEQFQFTKRNMHCGGCGNNCLLTSPGCAVGKETALQRGIKPDQQ